ncbi:phosphoserine phosphatase isoform X1 [Apis laboriosa]|uniref:phosphoserine phosphatase isoform X1 n=1 Tax=Apis laboriosa TaxID=183418 RepID=UPI001CC4673E|nr:phosphoserine phosphatase isoform X1 [Apis laboriosa]
MANLNELRSIWKNADAITFDVDSTVIQEEGIDELAKFCGKENDVISLTNRAMQGDMTFRQSLEERLNIIKPNLMQIKQFLASRPIKLSPGIKTLITTLQNHKKQIFFISGGFHSLIAPIATSLNIPLENIFANKLKFYYTGEYAGFDENQPTAENGGKVKVIKYLKNKKELKTIVHIGDGSTDLETTSIVDLFIGYGGNVIRENVKQQSLWYITDFNELVTIL